MFDCNKTISFSSISGLRVVSIGYAARAMFVKDVFAADGLGSTSQAGRDLNEPKTRLQLAVEA